MAAALPGEPRAYADLRLTRSALVRSWMDKGRALARAQRHGEAEQLFKRAVAVCEGQYGKGSPESGEGPSGALVPDRAQASLLARGEMPGARWEAQREQPVPACFHGCAWRGVEVRLGWRAPQAARRTRWRCATARRAAQARRGSC